MAHPILVNGAHVGRVEASVTGEYVGVTVAGNQVLFMHKSRAEELVHAIQSAMQDDELEFEAERGRIEEMGENA